MLFLSLFSFAVNTGVLHGAPPEFELFALCPGAGSIEEREALEPAFVVCMRIGEFVIESVVRFCDGSEGFDNFFEFYRLLPSPDEDFSAVVVERYGYVLTVKKRSGSSRGGETAPTLRSVASRLARTDPSESEGSVNPVSVGIPGGFETGFDFSFPNGDRFVKRE